MKEDKKSLFFKDLPKIALLVILYAFQVKYHRQINF